MSKPTLKEAILFISMQDHVVAMTQQQTLLENIIVFWETLKCDLILSQKSQTTL